jgi:DNA-binding NarL/FixJ family response regulator
MLPPQMRVLHVRAAARGGGWLAGALAADSACAVEIEDCQGAGAGLERLRGESFDAVLVCHVPGELDALEFLEAIQASGSDDPIVVLGDAPEGELSALCYEAGAQAYLCLATATTRTLIWTVARAVEHCRLVREWHRLQQAEARRLRQEHAEAQRLLDQQRELIRDLEALREPASGGEIAAKFPLISQQATDCDALYLPKEFVAHYRDLLRTYVMMGSGNLGAELATLAELLVAGGVTAPQTMQLHVRVLEDLVRGLGSRSSRHVMSRADMLALEVMLHLAEGYRLRPAA